MNQFTNDNINLTRVLGELRVRTVPILLASALAGLIAFGIAKLQPKQYEATARIMATYNTYSNNGLPSPPLPQGALSDAILNPIVQGEIGHAIDTLSEANFNNQDKSALKTKLASELAQGNMEFFQLQGRVDLTGNGTYLLSATNKSPLVAQTLVNAAAQALLNWDINRTQDRVRVAQKANDARIATISTLLNSAGGDKQALLRERDNLVRVRGELQAIERVTTPTLQITAPAVLPILPVAPKPTRSGALAALLTLIATSSLFALRSVLDRSVSAAIDLKALSLRLLGELPRIAGKNTLSVLNNLRQGAAGESMSFLRTNLNTLLSRDSNKIVLVTSSLPGEGKSNVCAALADAFAAAGQKTLIIDADLRRPSQHAIWAGMPAAEWVNLPGAAPFPGEEKQDLQAVLANPEAAQVKKLRHNLHFLPAGQPSSRAAELFSSSAFATNLKRWASGYDVVVIDSPPVLSVADPIVLAPQASGTLLVLEAGRATQEGVQRVMDQLMLNNARILGVVLNKVARVRHEDHYHAYPTYPADNGNRIASRARKDSK